MISHNPDHQQPILLYVHSEDAEHRFDTVDPLLAALVPLEQKYRGLTDLQRNIAYGTDVVDESMRQELLKELDAQDSALETRRFRQPPTRSLDTCSDSD